MTPYPAVASNSAFRLGADRGTRVEVKKRMNPLFGNPNSFLGGDVEDELPLVVGNTVEEASEVIILVCHSCEKSYGLPDEIDDARLLEMCPHCVHVFSSSASESEQPASLPDR